MIPAGKTRRHGSRVARQVLRTLVEVGIGVDELPLVLADLKRRGAGIVAGLSSADKATPEAIRRAFSPDQAAILIAIAGQRPAPEKYLSAEEAADRMALGYDVFRKMPVFDAANVAPQGHHKKYSPTTLDRIKANL